MRFNEENSLKRFLKRKVKITLGLIVAFMIMGIGAFGADAIVQKDNIIVGETEGYKDFNEEGSLDIIVTDSQTAGISGSTVNLNGKMINIKLPEKDKISGISGKSTITGKGDINIIGQIGSTKREDIKGIDNNWTKGDLTINVDRVTITGVSHGIYANTSQKTTITADTLEMTNFKINSSGNYTYGIVASTADIDLNVKNIFIEGENSNRAGVGISFQGGGNITINDADNLYIDAKAFGIELKRGTGEKNLVINTKNVTVKGDTIGINLALGNTDNRKVDIKGDNILISGKTGISVYTNKGYNNIVDINGTSKIEIFSTSTSNTKNAIYATNGSSVNINTDKIADVIINGDINSTGSSTGYETTKVSINFSTENSELNGKIVTDKNKNGDVEKNKAVSNIEFSNGATWNNAGDSSVTNLVFDGGIINNTGKTGDSFNNITINNLTGNGGTINMGAELKDGKAVSGNLTLEKVENSNAVFNINYLGDANLEVDGSSAEKVFNELGDHITITDGEFHGNAKLQEGFVSREYTAEFEKDSENHASVKTGTVQLGNINSMIAGIRDLATINLLTWRQEMSSLNQRMGELRNGQGEHGVWARVYAGKIENGSEYDNDYQTYQVGFDKKYSVDNGVVFVGGLVSYSKGETNYSHGEGENYSVGLGVYTTWLNNDGQFADVVLKQSRLHNKFDVKSRSTDLSQHGDYNNWGTSLSGQYGKRFDINDKFFIEPSTQLTLGRVEDTTYSTSAGVDVHQDTMYSLIGNIGTSVGYKFSEKGNVYLRAALVKEFQGDIDTEYSKDNAFERTSEDLGDTWAEFGVGVNYRFVENANVYLDLEKTGDSTVDTKWQANLGFRYEF